MSTPRKTPSQQRSRFTYDTILEAAAHIFDREGMAATTNRIAERAGVSVGSLYQYFPNKQALLHELALRHIDNAEAAFAEALQRVHATRPPIDVLVAEVVELAVAENGPLIRLHQLMREHAPRTPELQRRFQRLMQTVVDELTAYLGHPDDSDLRLRVRMAVTAIDSQVHQIVLDAPTPAERHRRAEVAADQALRVIRDDKPPSPDPHGER
jgi:AcrR family transcriptional regulator